MKEQEEPWRIIRVMMPGELNLKGRPKTAPHTIKKQHIIPKNDFAKMLSEAKEKSKVTDTICFSHCWWVEALIRCRNCPYTTIEYPNIIITDSRVRGSWLEVEKK